MPTATAIGPWPRRSTSAIRPTWRTFVGGVDQRDDFQLLDALQRADEHTEEDGEQHVRGHQVDEVAGSAGRIPADDGDNGGDDADRQASASRSVTALSTIDGAVCRFCATSFAR